MSIKEKLHGKRKLIPVILLLLIVSGSLFWYLVSGQGVLEGVVEATVVPIHSEVSGKILEMKVEPGQKVQAGELVASVDSGDQTYALQQLEIGLTKKEAVLTEMERGAEAEEVRQASNSVRIAQENYNSAKSTYELSASEGENAKALFQEGAISRAAYDQSVHQLTLARNGMDAAREQLANAQESLSLVQSGASEEKLIQARADVEQTRLQIEQARKDLEKFTIKALVSGTVISRNYLAGDLVSPGNNLADLSDESQLHLVTYLPEDALAKVEYGDLLTVKAGGSTFEVPVTFIDIQAEYTPKDFQTAANKNQDSFRMELGLHGKFFLKPGSKAKIYLP